MTFPAKRTNWLIASLAMLVAAVGLWGLRSRPQMTVAGEVAAADAPLTLLRVETVAPSPLRMARVTSQPGSAHSYQHADVYAKVSGYLKDQKADYGSRVNKGDVLAEIDVPELVQELEREKALQRQAEAEVARAEANVLSAKAESKATEALVAQAEANVARFESEREFRDKQFQRIRELHALNSIEERLVDEKLDQLNAARSSEAAARSAVVTARQQTLASVARIGNAESELLVTKAKIDVAKASLQKTSVLIGYTKVTSPYDGVVTSRRFHPGAFIRAAEHGGEVPLFSVDRIDIMRVIVQIPDRDVPYTQVGDKARIAFDALPEKPFEGKISRLAASEDPETRTMRVEIDLDNEDEIIHDGMYGQVEIELEPAAPGITIPSACLVGIANANGAKLFVAEGGKVRLASVTIGKDTGAVVEVTSGLAAYDRIVIKPPSALADGMSVDAVAQQIPKPGAH